MAAASKAELTGGPGTPRGAKPGLLGKTQEGVLPILRPSKQLQAGLQGFSCNRGANCFFAAPGARHQTCKAF